MPVWSPPIVVVQHILAPLTASFAKRLDQCVELTVGVAKEGEVLEPGCVLIAPGDKHLTVANENGCLRCHILESEKVQCHRPSVDVLFESLAHSVGDLALAALMTGMGEDGARGLGQIREAGGFTVAQDQATSVIWGMPGTAVRLGNAEVVLPLSEIAESLLARLSQLGAGEQS
jgi:two-component system chemotaxis response regulator CheB